MSAVHIPVTINVMSDAEYGKIEKFPLFTYVMLGRFNGENRFYYLDGLRPVMLMPHDVFSLWLHEDKTYPKSDANRYHYLSLGRWRAVERVYIFSKEAHPYFNDVLRRTDILGRTLAAS